MGHHLKLELRKKDDTEQSGFEILGIELNGKPLPFPVTSIEVKPNEIEEGDEYVARNFDGKIATSYRSPDRVINYSATLIGDGVAMTIDVDNYEYALEEAPHYVTEEE